MDCCRRLDDPELLDEREERLRVRRVLRSLAHLAPVDLLSQRPRDLHTRLVVERHLVEREQLHHDQVLGRLHEHRDRVDLELVRPLEVLVLNVPGRRGEDEVDEDVTVPSLVEPTLRWLLGTEARLLENGERVICVLLPEHEVDVVLGLRPSARRRPEPAAEHELDLRRAQRARRLLHALDEVAELDVLRHRPSMYPSRRLRITCRVGRLSTWTTRGSGSPPPATSTAARRTGPPSRPRSTMPNAMPT